MLFLRQLYLLPLSLLLLFFTHPAQAQQVLEGRVTDQQHAPVPFATVLAFAGDSSLLQARETDTGGRYRILLAGKSAAFLQVSAAGHEDAWLAVARTNDPLPDIVLGTASKSLKGVMVTARKPLVERKTDRTVFNVENSIATIGGDALDALRRAPGVRVTDNSVSIPGKSTVSVMINDKLQQLSGEELANVLKSIPADNLSRIEIITTPPARYDAAGNAGIINIVTRKMLRNGLNGTVTASYIQRTSRAGSLNGNYNYRHNKLNVFGFLNAYRANNMPDLSITTRYPDQRWEQHSDAHNNNVFNRTQIGADYYLAPGKVIGFLYTLGNGGDRYYGDVLIQSKGYNLQTGRIDSSTTTHALTQDRGVRNVANLNYQWKIDSTGRKLNIDLDYFTRTGRARRNLQTDNFFEDGTPTGLTATTRTSGVQKIDIRSGKADAEWPAAFASFTFGGKVSFIHNTSDNLFEYVDSGTYVTDTGKTNVFDYRENTQALYLSAQKEWGKWQVQAGLRAEYTQTRSFSATLAQTVRNEYLKLFPTLYIQYTPAEDHVLSFNYARRIGRPDFFDMNPFRMYFTATSYSQGNPFLQPSFSNNLELSYTLRSNYQLTVFTNIVEQLQTRVSFVDTVHKAYYFNMANVGTAKSYGASFSAHFNPLKSWDCQLSGSAWYSAFSSGFYGNAAGYTLPGFTLTTEHTFTLNKAKTLLADLSFTYNSRQLDDFDVTRANTSLQAGIKALLLKKKLTVAFNAFDIFRGERIRLENLYNGTSQDNYYDERAVRFSLTWKFGSSDIKARRERSGASEEENRVK